PYRLVLLSPLYFNAISISLAVSPLFHHHSLFSFLLLLPLPRSTLSPYTTLFRSLLIGSHVVFLLSRTNAPYSPSPSRFSSPSSRSEEHTSELQSRFDLVCRLLLEKKKELFMCDE